MADQDKSKAELIAELNNLREANKKGIAITNRLKKDLKELELLKEKYRLFFDNAPVGKSMTSPKGNLERINSAFSQLLGYSIDELKNLNFVKITHPNDLAESKECVRSLIAGENETWKMEKRYFHKKGHTIWTRVTTRLQRDENNNPTYFLTHIEDISEQKKYEQQLKDEINKRKNIEQELLINEQKLKTITSEAQVILFSFNQKGIFTFSEGKGLEKLGLTAGQVVGKSVFEVYKDIPQVVKESERVLKRELVKLVVDLGFIKSDTTYSPQFDDKGDLIKYFNNEFIKTFEYTHEDILKSQKY